MRKSFIALLFFSICLSWISWPQAHAAGSSYYVSTSGNDSNPGTLSQPFRTIQKASALMVAGDTCYISPGVYNETVTPVNSGTAGLPITYQALGDGVVISAADPISGWTVYSGNIYKANMNWTLNDGTSGKTAGMDQIFVNGKMMTEARWPNLPASVDPTEYRREYGALSDSGTHLGSTATYTKSGISSLPDPTGAYINEIAAAMWSPITGTVASRSGNTVTISRPAPPSSTYYDEGAGDYFFLWGKLNLLDTAKEWFRDSSGNLYLWAPNGNSPTNYLVEAKKRTNVLNLSGKSYLTFNGISTRAGAIVTDVNSTHLTLDNVDVQYSAHYTILTNYWTTRDVGTVLRGDYTTVRNSHFSGNAETVLLVTGNYATITNNVMHDASYTGANGYVLGVNNSTGSTVTNNTLYGGGTNMILDIRYSPAGTFMNNDNFYGSRITIDGGMVMTARNFADGQNSRVAYNFIHDGLGYNDASKNRYGTAGFYAEGAINNYIVDHNIIWNVTGSCIALGAGGEGAMSGWKVYNNTCTAGIVTAGDSITYSNFDIRNNIATYFWPDSKRNFLNTNLLTNYWDINGNLLPVIDPKYTNPSDFDYSLQSSSPAINMGSVVSPYTNGYTGTSPDAGAIEYSTPAFVSGALISSADIAGLGVAYNSTTNSFTISAAPNGRYLPVDFKLKVGTGTAGGTVRMNYNLKSWNISGLSIPAQGGRVYGQIGNNTPVAMNLVISGQNLVANPGFENGLANWSNDWGNSSVVNNNAHSGSYAIQAGTATGGRAQVITSGFSVGDSVEISGWGKLSNASGSGVIGIDFLNSSGGKIGGVSNSYTTTAYTQKSASGTVPSGTATISVYVYKDVSSAYFYADDVELKVTKPNLVLNPGFENGLTSWSNDWGNSSVVNSNAHTGSYALQTGTATGGRAQVITSGFGVGDTVAISGWGKLSSASGSGAIGVDFLNSSGGKIGGVFNSYTTTAYTQKTASATIPSGTATISVYLYKDTSSAYFYGDDIELKVIAP